MSVATAGSDMVKPRATVFSLNDNNPLVPYLYLLPHAVFFFVFIVYPVAYGIWVSTHRWDPLAPTAPYVGFEFYRNVFDPTTPQGEFFWKSLLNTLLFTAVSVPLLVGTSLGLALLLQRPIFGRTVFRAIFFMPGILSVSVMGILWKWMFQNQSGLVNIVRQESFGLPAIPFLTVEGWAWVPIIVGTVWWTIGFNMTLYLAALGNISESLYEAASIDGAGPWHKFRAITFPLLTPTTLFVAVTTVLASFQLFGQSRVITNGGPNRSTLSVIHYITDEAFGRFQFSQATAMAFIFGACMLVFTAIQFRIMAKDMQGGR